jgi:hypothetical protein
VLLLLKSAAPEADRQSVVSRAWDAWARLLSPDTLGPRPAARSHDEAMRALELAQQRLNEKRVTQSTAVDDEDIMILRTLAGHTPRLLTQDKLEAESRISRRTISARTKSLLAAGLIAQPKGPKSGTTITEIGRTLLRRIDDTKLAR